MRNCNKKDNKINVSKTYQSEIWNVSIKNNLLLFVLTIATLLPIGAHALKVSKVVSVYDGDTLRVDIDGYPDVVGKNMPVRIRGIDTPEIRGKCPEEKALAKKSRDFLRLKLAEAKEIELLDVDRGKYFRLLASVYVDGKSVGKLLISEGMARAYDGGKRLGWCW